MSLVLIAEDSASIRLLLRRRLEMAGYDVIEAHNGDDAVSAIEATAGDAAPDVVLLDVQMPLASGTEIMDRIKGIRPDLPVIVVSGMPGLGTSEVWQHADGRVSKPIDFDDLLGQINALTSGLPRP